MTAVDEETLSRLIMATTIPFFTAPYQSDADIHHSELRRTVDGKEYIVYRYNHGISHSIRQGQLAKDIIRMLAQVGEGAQPTELNVMAEWARRKMADDPSFLSKVELVSSFQRSGRTGECSGSTSNRPGGLVDPEFLKYERRDSDLFLAHAKDVGLAFASEDEYQLFAESLLWFLRNEGRMDEKDDRFVDLRHLRRVLRCAHTLDLRRVLTFDAEKILRDSVVYLLALTRWPPSRGYACITAIQRCLWHRVGEYLGATGDRRLKSPATMMVTWNIDSNETKGNDDDDGNSRLDFSDKFFLQNADPNSIIDAIYAVRKKEIVLSSSSSSTSS